VYRLLSNQLYWQVEKLIFLSYTCLRWCGAPWPLAAMRFSLPRIHAFQRKWHRATAAVNQAIIHARLAQAILGLSL